MSAEKTVNLEIDGMHCGSCVGRVERLLGGLEGVGAVSVNLATESARIELDDSRPLAEIAAALQSGGYGLRTGRAELDIADMTCASCVGRVEKALATAEGVTGVSVNLATGRAVVDYLEGVITPGELAGISGAAGYPATLREGDAADGADRHREEEQALRRRAILAAVLAVPVFVLEMGAHLVPAFHHLIARSIGTETSWLIQALLTTLVLAGPGRVFFVRGVPALWRGAPDMNSLVALGTAAAWGFSMVALFAPGVLPEGVRAVYFEAAAVIVVLILVGRWLEARAKGRTGAAIRALMGLRARTARVVRGEAVAEVPVEALAVGDVIQVRPGERIATDGVVIAGESHVDESMISGEPLPVAKAEGAEVTGGTVNGTGTIRFRATRVGAETVLAQVIRMVEDAQAAKLPIQGLVDRVTMWFVPAVIAVAALTVAAWLILGPTPALTHALVAGVSVLIIACPCAMGLATPVSIMVGTGRAAEMGVLFRRGDALQGLSEVGVIALDKTGTVTEGRPELTELVTAEGVARDEVLRLAAAVEAASEHPIAHAVLRAAEAEGLDVAAADGFRSITGFGAEARVEGQRVLVGAARLMAREGIDTGALGREADALAARGRTALFVALDGRAAAVIGVSDPVKVSSRAAIAALQAEGYEVAMITGDRVETAQTIAQEVGIARVIAGVLPDGKVAALDDLRQGGRHVAFVGDGINDAPALAHADVGIAIGTGTDVAIESADVVLMSGDLRGVVNAARVSRATMRNIRQNLVWAFGYNVALIPVAAGLLYPAFGLLLSPVFAAGAMALSSVSVLTNALRLRRLSPAMAEDGPVASAPGPAVDLREVRP